MLLEFCSIFVANENARNPFIYQGFRAFRGSRFGLLYKKTLERLYLLALRLIFTHEKRAFSIAVSLSWFLMAI